MKFKVPFVLALLLAMAGLVAAAPAQASDAQLRKVVKQQEKKVKAPLEQFLKASKGADDAAGLEEVQQASEEVRTAIAAYRKAVAPVKTSSAKGKKGKTKLLASLKEINSGLTAFETFIEKAQGGADKAELEASEKKFEKRLDKAEDLEDEAMKLLGIKSDD